MSSQFDFDNELSNLVKLDAPLQSGPVPRWQRRNMETSVCSNNGSFLTVNNSLHKSMSKGSCSSPMKLNRSLSLSQSISKTPKSANNTPGSKAKLAGKSKTPNKGGSLRTTPSRGCRFIPNREASNIAGGQYKFDDDSRPPLSGNEENYAYNNAMTDQLNEVFPEVKERILAFKERLPVMEGYSNNSKVLFSSSKKTENRIKTRQIPSVAMRVMDAPDLVNDYYLNLIDWSSKNILAVALGGALYLWDANTGDARMLMQDERILTAVKWIPSGQHVAIGTENAEVQLWDVTTNKRMRNMMSHAARVTTLSWNDHILTSGSLDGFIHHHDVRVANHHVATLSGHTQEVCGLEWSHDLKYLASGGNDNLVNLYDDRARQPLHTFSDHQGAVKAISWCPWQTSLLATGGGTNDRHIKLWDANSRSMVKSIDTNSQVCAIKWSPHHKELISSHGYARNQLTIWSYPSMQPIQDLLGHSARVLFMAISPDGTTICSGSADETLRMWDCFQVDARSKKKIGYGSTSTKRASQVDAFAALR